MTRVDIYSSTPYGIALDTLRNLVYVAIIDTICVADSSGNCRETFTR